MSDCVDIALPDEAATAALGARLFDCVARAAGDSRSGILITLDGPLGAGKSSLARALLRAAGIDGPIPSPTFTLVEPYEAGNVQFYHLDLYRLGDPQELTMLGFDEMRVPGAVVLMEWASRFESVRVQATLAIDLSYAGAGRMARLTFDQRSLWAAALD